MMMKVTSVESFDTPTVSSECHDEAPVADEACETGEACEPGETCETNDCCEGNKACGTSQANQANEACEADEMTEVEDVGNGCEEQCQQQCQEQCQPTGDDCPCYAGMPELIPLYDDETGDNESRHMPAPTTLDKVRQEASDVLATLQDYKVDYFIAGAMTQFYLPSLSNAVLAYVSAIPLLMFMNHPDWITDLPAENSMLIPGIMLILALSTSSSLMYASQIF
jgi:hypothetical protein